jgi:cytidyltransferase-like protein
MKIVYSYYVLDIIHQGHILQMENAKAIAGEDGRLVVGILTDEAAMEKKPKPILSFDERIGIARAIKYADVVVAQTTYSPFTNIRSINPDVLMECADHDFVKEVAEFMKRTGGRIISTPCYPSQSSTNIKEGIMARRRIG